MQRKRLQRAAARSRPHDRVLALLRARGPMSVDDIGRELRIAAIWRVVFDLEDGRYVVRRDRMVSAARFYTPKGLSTPVLALLVLGDRADDEMAAAS